MKIAYNITNEQYKEILVDILDGITSFEILEIPDVYPIIAAYYKERVIKRFIDQGGQSCELID